MEWSKLLSTQRVLDLQLSCKTNQPTRRPSQFTDARTEFERDSDQLIYSSQFRRLQDKTQVIPFPEFDFVHTRLTHTLEVASVGRSLGRLAGDFVFKKEKGIVEVYPSKELFVNNVAETVRAACLAHDIGNPSFGHSGEDAISFFFEEKFRVNASGIQLIDPKSLESNTPKPVCVELEEGKGKVKVNDVDKKKLYDLLEFEGNANGFRILTNCKNKALNPTCATLGAFSKYPRESILIGDPKKKDRKKLGKSQSKYGFFQTERDLFKGIAEVLGLLPIPGLKSGDLAWSRHPLAFLMEAADDICYQMIDFEDGCRLRLINFNEDYDIPVDDKVHRLSPRQILCNIAKIDDSFDANYTDRLVDRGIRSEISYLRSKAINVLTHLVFRVFKENYEGIMTGRFDNALIECIESEEIKINLKSMEWLIRNHVYTYSPVLESEAAGFKVIGGLLRSFGETTQICKTCNGSKKENAHQKKLMSLLPQKYHPKPEMGSQPLTIETIHSRYLDIIDYVSGMTDGFAISLYRKIEGISLPEIR